MRLSVRCDSSDLFREGGTGSPAHSSLTDVPLSECGATDKGETQVPPLWSELSDLNSERRADSSVSRAPC